LSSNVLNGVTICLLIELTSTIGDNTDGMELESIPMAKSVGGNDEKISIYYNGPPGDLHVWAG
jgi:hypothetical protein